LKANLLIKGKKHTRENREEGLFLLQRIFPPLRRRKSIYVVTMLAVLLVSTFLAGFNVQSVRAATITVPDNYSTIQAAINAASNGDTINVRAGTYNGQVIINKTVSLIGENRVNTFINESAEIGDVVIIQANGVLISNFTINGYKRADPIIYPSYWVNGSGIRNQGYNNTVMINIGLTNAGHNEALIVNKAYNTALTGSYINGNIYGALFTDCTNVTLLNNDIRNNHGFTTSIWGDRTTTGQGIYLNSCYNVTMRSNILQENGDDFCINGEELGHFLHDIDTSNLLLNGTTRKIYYLINQHEKEFNVSSYPDLGFLALVNSTKINVHDFDLVDNTPAILLAYTNDSSVTNNTLRYCTWAMRVVHSSNNTILRNAFAPNNTDTLDMKYSTNNTIAENEVFDNTGSGFWVTNSSQNIIANNNITGTSGGIYLQYSDNNTLLGNNATNCRSWEGGIYFLYSCNNTMRNNIMQNNSVNFRVVAYFDTELSQFTHYVDPSNLVDGKHIYYLINHHGETVDPSTYPDAGFLALVNSTGIIAKNLSLEGMLLGYTNNSQIQHNIFVNYSESITMVKSSSNSISENNITKTGYGIQLFDHSGNNTLIQNNVTNVGTPCIETRYCENNTITQNVLKNSDSGVRVDSSPNTIITGNNATDHTFEGIEVEFGSDFCTVAGNTVANNDNSIWLQGASNCTVYKNDVSGSGFVGIRLAGGANNNTISENKIRDSGHDGIYFDIGADNNKIIGNDIKNSTSSGIELWILTSNNTVMNNKIADSGKDGFHLEWGSFNLITGNSITNSSNDGMHIEGYYQTDYPEYTIPFASWYNRITLNNVTQSGRYGFYIDSANNTIVHNRFVNYTTAASSDPSSPNIWDDGYPSGGNYWSNFVATDIYSGPNQNIPGGDGIADSPFIMNANNTDHYPLLESPIYSATIVAHCNTEGTDVSVAITKDGVSSGQNTPYIFTGLLGTHNFTVPSIDSSGHPFKQWNTGLNSTTITVTSGAIYTAYYEASTYNVTILAHCNTEGTDVIVPITKDNMSSGFNTPYIFTGLVGTHTFSVPSTDGSGHAFKQWSTGETTTTITVSSNGNLTAIYEAQIQTTYNATIKAYCNQDSCISVPITKDGLATCRKTPYCFVDLTGSHNFTVPCIDACGHPFKQWNTGETSTTITVDSNGTYTAEYGISPECLVVRGQNNQIYYRTRLPASTVWSSWTALTGSTSDSPSAAICGNELHIVVRGSNNGQLWHGYLNIGTNSFSGWELLSGSTPSPPTLTGNSTHLCLVVRGSNNQIYYRFYTLATRSWTDWSAVPNGTTLTSPAATLTGKTLQIAVQGSNSNQVWHGYVNFPSGTFSGWTLLDGSTPSSPALTCNGTGLCLVVRGSNNQIYYRLYNLAAKSWTSWTGLQHGTTPEAPAATITGGNLQIAVRGSNYDQIWFGSLQISTNTWSEWTLLDGSTPSKPVLTS
jgi:parallel beta-helix repeat protein